MLKAELWGTKCMSKTKPTSATAQASVQDAIKDLTKFLKTLDTVPIKELTESAATMKAEMIAQAPYETGRLERSVYTTVSRDKGRPGIRAGASARSSRGYNYAGIQHENESFKHPVKGKAFFIRDPFVAETERLKERLREELKVTKE